MTNKEIQAVIDACAYGTCGRCSKRPSDKGGTGGCESLDAITRAQAGRAWLPLYEDLGKDIDKFLNKIMDPVEHIIKQVQEAEEHDDNMD